MSLPLPWDQVRELCAEAGTDGLLVLEVFDTDQRTMATGVSGGLPCSISARVHWGAVVTPM